MYKILFCAKLCSVSIFQDCNSSKIGKAKIYVLCCAIWYHLYNFKNVRNTHGRVLLLVNFIKSNTPHGCFLNCTNCTFSKLYKWYQIVQHTTYIDKRFYSESN